MQLDKQQIEKIIAVLQAVQEKPMMFVGTDVLDIVHYLNGFETAITLTTPVSDFQATVRNKAQERGWRLSAGYPIDEMREAGLKDNDIVNELLTIHLAAWHSIIPEPETSSPKS